MSGPDTTQPKLPYATASRRAAALGCDVALLSLAAFLLHKAIFSFFLYNALGQLCVWAYFVGFESSKKRATPGKTALGIFVADEQGRGLLWPRALKRFFLFTLPFLPLTVFTLSDRYAAFNDRLRLLAEAGDRHGVRVLLHSPDTVYMAHEQAPLFFMGLLLSVFFYWLPLVIIPQKTGLHDLGAHTRVFKKGGGLKDWFRESYGVDAAKKK